MCSNLPLGQCIWAHLSTILRLREWGFERDLLFIMYLWNMYICYVINKLKLMLCWFFYVIVNFVSLIWYIFFFIQVYGWICKYVESLPYSPIFKGSTVDIYNNWLKFLSYWTRSNSVIVLLLLRHKTNYLLLMNRCKTSIWIWNVASHISK